MGSDAVRWFVLVQSTREDKARLTEDFQRRKRWEGKGTDWAWWIRRRGSKVEYSTNGERVEYGKSEEKGEVY